MTDYNPDADWKHYLVTVDIPMPNGMDAPRPLRTTVSIQAPHADAARWRAESYSPVRIIDVQEVTP